MNEYAEMLECQLRFAEEEKERAVEMAYQQGVGEGEKKMSEIIIRNVIASLEEIKNGYGTLDEFIEQLKGALT